MPRGDVGYCFYNYWIPELASWFGFDDPMTRADWEADGFRIGAIYDDESGAFAEPELDRLLYPCMEGMWMGWSWGLFFANEATAFRVAQTGTENGLDAMRERQPTPDVRPGVCITGTYVDNVQIIAGVEQDYRSRVAAVSDSVGEAKIPFGVSDESEDLETLGLVYHFGERRLRHRPKRVWRLYQATHALMRRHRQSSKIMEIW